MQVIKVNQMIKEIKAKSRMLKWRAAVLFIPVIIALLMPESKTPHKEKAQVNCTINNSYCAGDVALFVAMPLLNMVMR